MSKFSLLFCFILLLAGFASAQTNQNAACPTIEARGGGIPDAETPLSFTADVKDYDLSKLSYRWTISAGVISKGQGTTTITVTDFKNGENVTAVVEVTGLPEGCPSTAFETGAVCSCVFPSKLIDEFGTTSSEAIWARLDAYYIALGNEPNAQGYIINYGTNREIARREALIKKYTASRRFDSSRLTMVRSGIKSNGQNIRTKFWIVPPGADVPTP